MKKSSKKAMVFLLVTVFLLQALSFQMLTANAAIDVTNAADVENMTPAKVYVGYPSYGTASGALDNRAKAEPRITLTGSWTVSGSIKSLVDFGGINCIWSSGGTITYKPTARELAAGTYDVKYIHVTKNDKSEDTAATLEVAHKVNGTIQTQTATLNQQSKANGFEEVIFSGLKFTGDGTEYVSLTRGNLNMRAGIILFDPVAGQEPDPEDPGEPDDGLQPGDKVYVDYESYGTSSGLVANPSLNEPRVTLAGTWNVSGSIKFTNSKGTQTNSIWSSDANGVITYKPNAGELVPGTYKVIYRNAKNASPDQNDINATITAGYTNNRILTTTTRAYNINSYANDEDVVIFDSLTFSGSGNEYIRFNRGVSSFRAGMIAFELIEKEALPLEVTLSALKLKSGETFSAVGSVTVNGVYKLTLKTTNSGSAQTIKVIVANYQDNQLVGIDMQSVTIPENATNYEFDTNEFSVNKDVYTYKVFVFDSFNAIRPLMNAWKSNQ